MNIRTYLPDPRVLLEPYDSEMPCKQFWHSHKATFAMGRVEKLIGFVPFTVTVSTTSISYS